MVFKTSERGWLHTYRKYGLQDVMAELQTSGRYRLHSRNNCTHVESMVLKTSQRNFTHFEGIVFTLSRLNCIRVEGIVFTLSRLNCTRVEGIVFTMLQRRCLHSKRRYGLHGVTSDVHTSLKYDFHDRKLLHANRKVWFSRRHGGYYCTQIEDIIFATSQQ